MDVLSLAPQDADRDVFIMSRQQKIHAAVPDLEVENSELGKRGRQCRAAEDYSSSGGIDMEPQGSPARKERPKAADQACGEQATG